MDIDAAQLRNGQRPGRQDRAVRYDHQGVEVQPAQQFQHLRRFETCRLVHIQAELRGTYFDRSRMQRLAAARRAIRLREHGANPMHRCERLQCRDSELWRAGETQP